MAWAKARDRRARLLTVAGDTPFFPHDLAARLADAVAGRPDRIAVAASGGRRHPVFALWPVSLEADLSDFLAESATFSVAAFLERHRNGKRRLSDGDRRRQNARPVLQRQHAGRPCRGGGDPARTKAMTQRVFGITGWKNSGKTTLTEKLVAELTPARLESLDRQARASRLRHRQARAPTAFATGRQAPARSPSCPAGAGR